MTREASENGLRIIQDQTPLRADIDMTRSIVDTAKPLGIVIHDHIIVGKNGHIVSKGCS